MDGSHDLRRTDLRLGVKNDLKMVATTDVSRDLHTSDLLGDPKMVVMMDASRGHRKSVLRWVVRNLVVTDDRKMDASRGHRKSVLHLDVKNLDGMTDVSHDLHRNDLHSDEKNLDAMDDRKRVENLYPHMSDLLGDRMKDATMDGSRGRHRNDPHLGVTGDRNLDVTGDRMKDATMDGSLGRCMSVLHLDVMKSHRVDLSIDPEYYDQNLSAVDASRGLHTSDLHLAVMGDRMMVGNLYPHMSDLHLDGKILDVNLNCHRVIRKCALHVTNY